MDLACFFGEEEKKARIPPFDAGAGAGFARGMIGAGAGIGGGAFALNWARMCASRRTLRVKVNSSLGLSMLYRCQQELCYTARMKNSQFELLIDYTVR